jgi:hypothetical protein
MIVRGRKSDSDVRYRQEKPLSYALDTKNPPPPRLFAQIHLKKRLSESNESALRNDTLSVDGFCYSSSTYAID